MHFQSGSLPESVSVAINTRSRRGRAWAARVHAELKSSPIRLIKRCETDDIHTLRAFLAERILAEDPMIAVGGGDGTLGSVAQMFERSATVMGVLPLGTGNAFARDLGLPVQPEQATRVLWEGKLATVDVGVANGHRFLNVATVGLSTDIATSLTVTAKRRFGRLVYAWAVIKALLKSKAFHVRIRTEHGEYAFDTLQVVIGNGRYHAGPFLLSPEASITEGRLTLYALSTTRRTAFFRLAYRLRRGKHVELPEVHAVEAKGGWLLSDPVRPVTMDGETRIETPIRFEALQDALRVAVPAPWKP